MKDRAFALLLAAFVMLLGAGTTAWIKAEAVEESAQNQTDVPSVQSGTRVEEEFLLPVAGTVEREFGAEYSEEYGQWTMCPYIELITRENAQVSAPLSGTITRIEARSEGGSCIALECGQTVVEIFPVYYVRVAEGNSVRQGEVLGSAHGRLIVQAVEEGYVKDPRQSGKTSSFDKAAGAERDAVE